MRRIEKTLDAEGILFGALPFDVVTHQMPSSLERWLSEGDAARMQFIKLTTKLKHKNGVTRKQIAAAAGMHVRRFDRWMRFVGVPREHERKSVIALDEFLDANGRLIKLFNEIVTHIPDLPGPYSLHIEDWPPALKTEFQELITYKKNRRVSGRFATWAKPGTITMASKTYQKFFGYVTSNQLPTLGCLKPVQLTLGLLAYPPGTVWIYRFY